MGKEIAEFSPVYFMVSTTFHTIELGWHLSFLSKTLIGSVRDAKKRYQRVIVSLDLPNELLVLFVYRF